MASARIVWILEVFSLIFNGQFEKGRYIFLKKRYTMEGVGVHGALAVT